MGNNCNKNDKILKKILEDRGDRTGDCIVIEQPPYPLDHIDLYKNLMNLKNINIEKRNLEDFEMKIQFFNRNVFHM